ncbi:MAG: 50S ribosomal protein L29 [bacterium]|jgi:ribosomal protein L29
MKTRELRELKAEELDGRIREVTQELRDLQLKHRSGEGADKPVRIRMLRRDVARMQTLAHARKAGK